MKFTDEQQAAIDLAVKGENFSLVAPAGSGKSATAVGMALALKHRLTSADERGLYLVYNTQARKDAEAKFKEARITWFDVRTTSQIAWRAFANTHKDRMAIGAPAVPAKEVAKALNLTTKDFGDKLILDGFTQARLAADTIDRFCNSAHKKITESDVFIPVIGPGEQAIMAARSYIARLAQVLWRQSIREESNLRFTMNHAFKLVAEEGKNYGYGVVITDEAQDSNDCTVRFIQNQKGAQSIMVGDPAQALYEWRGASDQILRHDGQRLHLTQCQPAGTLVRVPIVGERVNRFGPIPASHEDVKIEDIREGDRVVSWSRERGFCNSGNVVNSVSTRFHSGNIVVANVDGLESKYAPNHHCVVTLGDTLAEGEFITYLMRRGNQYRVGRCPWKYGNGHGPIRRARREGADAFWILSVHKTEKESALAEALVRMRYQIPGEGWRELTHYTMDLDTFWLSVGDNSKAAEACLLDHELLPENPLWETHGERRRGWSTQVITAACNVRSGMKMLVADSNGVSNGSEKGFIPWSAWKEVTITHEPYEGVIYSLSVEDDHTYIADGVVTHNSFRFGDAVAAEAMKHLPHTETGVTIKGLSSINDTVSQDDMEHPDVVLCRTNAGAMTYAISYLMAGKRVAMVRGTKQILDVAFAARDLMAGRKARSLELSAFDTWSELVEFTKEPGGGHLKAVVKLIDVYGISKLIDACNKMTQYSQPHDVAVTTCHSIKGLEWKNVQVGDDFREPEPFENPLTQELELGVIDRHEAMIHYVAVTRAQEWLDRGGLKWIDGYSSPVSDAV